MKDSAVLVLGLLLFVVAVTVWAVVIATIFER